MASRGANEERARTIPARPRLAGLRKAVPRPGHPALPRDVHDRLVAALADLLLADLLRYPPGA